MRRRRTPVLTRRCDESPTEPGRPRVADRRRRAVAAIGAEAGPQRGCNGRRRLRHRDVGGSQRRRRQPGHELRSRAPARGRPHPGHGLHRDRSLHRRVRAAGRHLAGLLLRRHRKQRGRDLPGRLLPDPARPRSPRGRPRQWLRPRRGPHLRRLLRVRHRSRGGSRTGLHDHRPGELLPHRRSHQRLGLLLPAARGDGRGLVGVVDGIRSRDPSQRILHVELGHHTDLERVLRGTDCPSPIASLGNL